MHETLRKLYRVEIWQYLPNSANFAHGSTLLNARRKIRAVQIEGRSAEARSGHSAENGRQGSALPTAALAVHTHTACGEATWRTLERKCRPLIHFHHSILEYQNGYTTKIPYVLATDLMKMNVKIYPESNGRKT